MSNRRVTEIHAVRSTQTRNLLLLALLLGAVVATMAWLSGAGESGAGGAQAVVAVPAGSAPGSGLSALDPASGEQLDTRKTAAGPDSGSNATFRPEELLTDYPRTTIHGRVLLLDKSIFPQGMTIAASRDEPLPALHRFDLSMIRDGATVSGFSAISDAALRARTRVPVGADGRFEMPDFPLDRPVWLAVEHTDWYEPVARLYEVSGDPGDPGDDELIVELSRGATITGRVVDDDGQPIAGLTIAGGSTVDPYAMLDGSTEIVKLEDVVTDERGRFVLTPVPANAPLVLSTGADFGLQPTAHKIAGLAPAEISDELLVVLAGGVISGQVLDVDGLPVPGTEVQILPTSFSMGDVDTMGQLAFNKLASTDADGQFVFDSLSDGSYRLVLVQDGFRTTPSRSLAVQAGQELEGIILTADRGLSVAGQVVGPDGEPLTGATVSGFLPPSMFSLRAAADRDYRASEAVDELGRFNLSGFDEGKVRVRARAPGYVDNSLDVVAGASELTIPLQPKTTLTGIAIDLASGEPLSDYQLRLLPADGQLNMSAIMEMGDRLRDLQPPLDVSDGEGRFSIDNVTPGVFDLLLVADGYAQTALRDVEAVAGHGAQGLIIMVPEEASVIGQVVSGRTGATLPGVTVTTGGTSAMDSWLQMMSGPVPKTTTDSEGRFELGGLGSEPLTISFQEQDHLPVVLSDVVLRSGEVRDEGLITLPPGAMVHGTVYGADEQPQAGVAVLASDLMGRQMKRAITDDEGRYAISGLAGGTFNVMRLDFSLSTESDSPAGILGEMTFETIKLEPEEVARVDLGAPSATGCLLEGVVRNSAGPEAEAMVMVLRESGPPATRFTGADDEGHYAIKNLAPGDYVVQVFPAGSLMGGGQPSTPIFSSLVIGDESHKRQDFEVPGAFLSGETRARNGQRLKGIRLLLERVDDGRPRSRFIERMGSRVGELYSDDQGEFRFEHLPAGTYAIQAGGTNLIGLGEAGWAVTRMEDFSVREGSGGFKVVIELMPGGALSGVARGPDGQPLANVPVWARDDNSGRWMSVLSENSTDASGRYTINSLEPGPWTLAFGGDQWALTLVNGLRVTREEVREKDVQLERGVEVFASLGPYAGQQLTAWIQGPQGLLPSELTSLNGLIGGSGGNSARQRLGRLPRGSYSVTLLANGETVKQDTIVLGHDDIEVVVSLEEDS